MTVLVVDDSGYYRTIVKRVIEKGFPDAHIFEASDSSSATIIINDPAITIDLMILDARLGEDEEGGDIASNLRKRRDYAVKIIGITSYEGSANLISFARSGIHGLILKSTTSASQIIDGVKAVLDGKEYFPDDVKALLADYAKTPLPEMNLTQRERDLIRLLKRGLTERDIAQVQGTPEQNVRERIAKVQEKTNTRSVSDLVDFVLKNGLLPPA